MPQVHDRGWRICEEWRAATNLLFSLGNAHLAKVNQLLSGITIALVILALACSAALLAKNTGIGILPRLPGNVISGVSLLLVGIAFLILQLTIRPWSKKLLKNLLLAATFILWGVIQLMPRNTLSLRLGRLVIALLVVELAWVILLGPRPTQGSMPPRAYPQIGGHRGKS